MSYQTILPPEAAKRIESGWTYIDVRTVREFEAGHPSGAFNVPFAEMDLEAGGLVPNPHFVEVMQRAFPADAPLVLGCAAGGRSRAACEALAAAGFRRLANMHGGFSGARPPAGPEQPGWRELGLPTSTQAPPERCYAHLRGSE
jgi:rhodanese-related sulfurtransferase